MVTEAHPQIVRIRKGFVQQATPYVGLTLVAVVVAWLVVNLVRSPANWFEVLLIGISNGALYALIALGYTLVYGILQLINFAHGDVFALGGLMSMTLVTGLFTLESGENIGILVVSIVGMLAIVMAFCGAINVTVEFVAYRKLRNAPRLAPLITAIGASFLLANIGLVFWGPEYVTSESVLPRGNIFSVGGVEYRWNQLIVVMITVPVLVALVYLVQRTRQGKAMRAVAQDKEAAGMMGINVNRTISFTFLIAGSLAGAAGVVYALYFTNVRYDQGFQLGLIAFTAAVVGGIGNLPGAVLGAMIIGLIQAFNEGLGWAAPGASWTQSIVFSILILILVFRPAGLLGEGEPEGA